MNKKKIPALAGVLALCLLLTGCYIAPDDVSTGGNQSTVNNRPFATLAPTATVYMEPDTVVVPSQDVFGGAGGAVQAVNTATPTPDPASQDAGGNDYWTTVQPGGIAVITEQPTAQQLPTAVPLTGTAVPAPGTIGVITAGPTATRAPVTPTPTPKSLQLGFTGSDEVRSLQKRLKELGYYKGNADGDFGPATDKAVKEFQKANGLTADGKAGAKTLEKLYSKEAVSYAQAHATATPKPTARVTARPTARVTATPRATATPDLSKEYYLQLGSKGNRVTQLQKRLISLGWLSGKASGTYDEDTEAAVRAFQRKTPGLWEDGVAGPGTLKAVYSEDAARSSAPVAGSGETLEMGSEGDEVKALQKRLKELGYLKGSADGKFGVATQAAVIAFQQNNKLTADGKAGSATLRKLYSSDAIRSGGNAVNIDSSGSGGRDTSGISSTGYVTLEEGSTGEQVKNLQKRLKELGYYKGNVDGSFGEGTTAAVMAFQLRNNLTVDGKAGPATQRVLYGSKAAITYSALRMGDTGQAVKNLQYTLYELGYYDGSIDGVYGQTTSDAVRAFQIQNKLSPVDGVAGSNTLAKMYSSDAVPATAANVDYDTVRPGDRGEVVVEIQDCLMDMGYLDDITGIYDDATTEAVKAFQRDHGLTPDGVCGAKTLVILFGY